MNLCVWGCECWQIHVHYNCLSVLLQSVVYARVEDPHFMLGIELAK